MISQTANLCIMLTFTATFLDNIGGLTSTHLKASLLFPLHYYVKEYKYKIQNYNMII